MKIRVLGAGFYGCHISKVLIQEGHSVEIHEAEDSIFCGASGSIPARMHMGFHYPRSKATRDACQSHQAEFMAEYGHLTRGVPINLYAIAKEQSMIDFPQYIKTMQGEAPFIPLSESDCLVHGLHNIEGALLTSERHIITDDAKAQFEHLLGGHIHFNSRPGVIDDSDYDLTIDCTFCANDGINIDRYEPCIVGMMFGPTDKAVTIMDGPFSSLYPWNHERNLVSLSSAKWSPFTKNCKTWHEARNILDTVSPYKIKIQLESMFEDICRYFPQARNLYSMDGYRLSIRAMPKSGSDSRLVDIQRVGKKSIRIRAGKIDAVVATGNQVLKIIKECI